MNTFRSIFGYAPEYRGWIIASLLVSAVATITSFVPYYYVWYILTEIFSANNREVITGYATQLVVWLVIYSVVYFMSLIFSHIFAFRLETNIKKRGITALLTASFTFFDQQSSGRVRKIIDDNTANTHMIVAHILPDLVNTIIFPICLLVLSFWVSFSIGIFMLAGLLFAVFCFAWMSKRNDKNMMAEYLEALEEINIATVEYVRGIQVIKIFDTVLTSFEKLHHAIYQYAKVVNRQCQNCRLPYTLFRTGMLSLGMLLIPLACYWLSNGTPPSQVVCTVAFTLCFSGLMLVSFIRIMKFQQELQMATDAITKIDSLLTQMDQNKLATGSVNKLAGTDIVFDQVTFGYEKGRNVLENFNLTLENGKMYALVGSSGGGKSTVAKLISGFYPPTSGRILIGGVSLADYTEEVRSQSIAFVFQHAKLFQTSIYENVAVARPEASYDEVMQALSDAMCDDILAKFPQREQTVIGSSGVHLSGGEMQRICVARALLKDAPIVVLDEAAAASDPENEYQMQQAFAKLMQGKTVIMIAHRLPSIRGVHEILLIEDGKVHERGSHEELMQLNRAYASLTALYEDAQTWRIV